MERKSILTVDVAINLVLGIMLLIYPFTGIEAWLGVPLTEFGIQRTSFFHRHGMAILDPFGADRQRPVFFRTTG